MASDTATLLPFAVGNATCALPVERVSTALDDPAVTPIPKAPASVAGLINLRGTILPVLDLRVLFGMPKSEEPGNVIVAEAAGSGPFGLRVDSIRKVAHVPAAAVAADPPAGLPVPREYLGGVAMLEEEYFIVLDPEALCDLEAVFGRKRRGGERR